MVKIINVPAINGLGKTKGTELAPKKISKEGETLQLDVEDVEEQEKTIYSKVKALSEKTIFIGGDHSITYPITKALLEKNPTMKLIILDAHPDLMPPMKNPTHEEWLSAIIKQGLAPENILLIGARNIDPKEKEYQINTIAISEIENSKEKIKKFIKNSKIYFSIDIDFFDAEVAPATGYPEKEGAKKDQGLTLIRNIAKESNLIGADIVEINPTKTEPEKTIELAKEVLEILKNQF